MCDDIIIISSDEDSCSVEFLKKNEFINSADKTSSSSAETTNIKLQNLEDVSVATARTEKTITKFFDQSNNAASVIVKTENKIDDTEITESNICESKCDTFEKFMNVVLSVEDEEENKAKLIKKLNKYHKQSDPDYIKSAEFKEVIEKGIEKINKNSVYLYFVLKDVKDCLVANRVELKSKEISNSKIPSTGEDLAEESGQGKTIINADTADSNKDKQRIVDKLTALLGKLSEKIKELEETEVDFSDEENSSYFKMQRYRERYSQVYQKLCTYTHQPLNANRIGGCRRINFSYTDNLELNRAIEKWLNKTKQFPDFRDVYKLLNELNQSLDLKYNKDQVKIHAEKIFEKIGNMLQRRRHYDLWDSLSSFLNDEMDPAVEDPELDILLKKNYEIGIKKEKELISYYVEKQEKEKLQPREVADEEADCSPTESGDDDEKEIEKIENILNLETSSDDDEYEEKNDEESRNDDGTFCYSNSKTIEGNSKNLVVAPKIKTESDGHEAQSMSLDNFIGADHCGSKYGDGNMCVNSNRIGTIVENRNNKIPNKDRDLPNVSENKQHVQDDSTLHASTKLTEVDNEQRDINTLKRVLQIQETKNFKKSKLINKSDSDSDCEVIEIITNEKVRNSTIQPLKRRMYQINYAFINSTFNHSTILSNNICKKVNGFCSNFKTMKNQKSFLFPLSDLTNIKSIGNKFARYKETKIKKKPKNRAKLLSSITYYEELEDPHLLYKRLFIALAKNNITCALQQETGSENMKNQREPDRINENNGFRQGSNDESVTSPNNGGSGGGNGQDNSENNGNKKPFDQEKLVEDNQESEDKEDNEEEGTDSSEINPSQLLKAIKAVPKLDSSIKKKCRNVKTELNKSQANSPSSKRTVREKKEPEALVPPLRIKIPKTAKTSNRKKKVDKNEAIQGTSRESNVSTFDINVPKVATVVKQEENKALPTVHSNEDDVEIIQIMKKKRTTPVRAVQSDEEIVKNFLQRSHPSISITTPKKRTLQSEPSASIVQALQTLSRLKGISATIVRGSSKCKADEDVTVIGESLNTRANQISKQCKTENSRTDMTESFDCVIPKIVTVQGNVSGFENIVNDGAGVQHNIYPECVQNPIQHQTHMANVSGINTTNFEEKFDDIPIPRFRNVKSRSRRTPKNKTKNVEYVILD